jgi:putative nucleotidyltransferase with HDIG domain
MEDMLINYLPELNLIKNENLKKKTISTWIDAIKIGGWGINDLKRIPFTLLIHDCHVNIIEHTRSVTNTSIEAAKVLIQFNNNEYSIDFDILICGGLLHDVGKLLEYEDHLNTIKKGATGKLLRHPFSGAGLAMKHGLPTKVVHIIAVHAREGDNDYRCPEAIIVHHADFMNFEPLKSPNL